MTSFSKASLVPEFERLLSRKVEEAVQEAANEAAERVRKLVIGQTAQFTAGLYHEFSMERRGSDIVITLKIKDESK